MKELYLSFPRDSLVDEGMTLSPSQLLTFEILYQINSWWYFAMISISGIFAVTFSVVFAYVADVTDKEERSAAYGLGMRTNWQKLNL